jgi:hypothetical protein
MAVTFAKKCTCIIVPSINNEELRRSLYYSAAEIQQFKRERKESRRVEKAQRKEHGSKLRYRIDLDDSSTSDDSQDTLISVTQVKFPPSPVAHTASTAPSKHRASKKIKTPKSTEVSVEASAPVKPRPESTTTPVVVDKSSSTKVSSKRKKACSPPFVGARLCI